MKNVDLFRLRNLFASLESREIESLRAGKRPIYMELFETGYFKEPLQINRTENWNYKNETENKLSPKQITQQADDLTVDRQIRWMIN